MKNRSRGRIRWRGAEVLGVSRVLENQARKFGYLTATLGVLGASGLLFAIRDTFLDKAYVGLVFLFVVAAAAAIGGTPPAVVAALLAFICWNFFFLSPYYTLELADPREWVMLSLFLVIGLLIGHITGRLRLREEEAIGRERHMASLYEALLAAQASREEALEEQRKLERLAAEAAAQQEVERLRGTLLSSLSHSLKTPLAALTATLTSLRSGDVEWDRAAIQEGLDEIFEDLERLTEHIENLLSLAHLESGDWKPAREWISLREVVATAVRPFSETDARRIRIDALAGNPLVRVDLVQMSQAVRHLLENALSYSPVTSLVSVDACAGEEGIDLWVDDEGPGVSAAEAELVFRRFFRGDAARRDGVRGTGLGLAICREIVVGHGGTLDVTRAPAGGARFRLRLPHAAYAFEMSATPRVSHEEGAA